jgi:hypothetical protein
MRHYHNQDMTIPESANAAAPRGFTLVRAFPDLLIKLEQRTNKAALFRVTYGLEVRDELPYALACKKFGEAVFHALACDGVLNNDGE